MHKILTTMIAILPPTSPTTFIGGFSLAGWTGTPTETSIVRERLRVLHWINYKFKSMIKFFRKCLPWQIGWWRITTINFITFRFFLFTVNDSNAESQTFSIRCRFFSRTRITCNNHWIAIIWNLLNQNDNVI